MALNKDIQQPSGVMASYHRISHIVRDVHNNIKVVVDSYKDKNAREHGKECMSSQTCAVPAIDLEQPMLEQLYEALKLLPQFDQSSDE